MDRHLGYVTQTVVVHKVDIFVQILMKINWKWLRVESIKAVLYRVLPL